MRSYKNQGERAVYCFGLLIAILVAVSIFGYYCQPASGTTVCAPQLIAAPQILPAFPSYTATPFYSNTLNFVGAEQRQAAIQQWTQQTAQAPPRWSAAQLRAMLAEAEQQEAGQLPPLNPATGQPWTPAERKVGEMVQAGPPVITGPPPAGIPPYAYAGEIPTIVARCAKCHTDGYSAEGAAGGLLLDGSSDLRAPSSWQHREAIMSALADRRMPPEGHEFSGALAGQITLELYAGRADAGGNPANPESP